MNLQIAPLIVSEYQILIYLCYLLLGQSNFVCWRKAGIFLGNTDRVISKGVAAKIAVRSNGLNNAGTDQSMRLFVAYAAPVYYCVNGKKI